MTPQSNPTNRIKGCSTPWNPEGRFESQRNETVDDGWGDLSYRVMASRLIVDQMPVMGDPNRVQVKQYPGEHMFYSRGTSQAALRQDVMKAFAAH